MNAQGQIIKSFTWGLRGPAVEYTHAGASVTPLVYVLDWRGNTRSALSAEGTVLGNASYDAWGNARGGSVPTTYGLRASSGYRTERWLVNVSGGTLPPGSGLQVQSLGGGAPPPPGGGTGVNSQEVTLAYAPGSGGGPYAPDGGCFGQPNGMGSGNGGTYGIPDPINDDPAGSDVDDLIEEVGRGRWKRVSEAAGQAAEGLSAAADANPFVSAFGAVHGTDALGHKRSPGDRIFAIGGTLGGGALKGAGKIAKGVASTLGRKAPHYLKDVNKINLVPRKFWPSKALRHEATEIWQAFTGYRAFSRGLQIHHRIPLEYSHIMPGDPNRLANLVGVPQQIHTLISARWTAFRVGLNGRTPTPSEVMAFALRIDEEFGAHMVFPR